MDGMKILEAKAKLAGLITALHEHGGRARVQLDATEEELVAAAELGGKRDLALHGDTEWDRVRIKLDDRIFGAEIELTSSQRPRVPRCANCGGAAGACDEKPAALAAARSSP